MGGGNRGHREIKLNCFYRTSINVSLDTIIEMKSFIRGMLERVSFSVKSHTAVAAAAAPALWRWGIQYDQKIIDRKIAQANEDHCGCCVVDVVVGDDTKKNKTEAVKNKSLMLYEKTEEYLVPYVM